MRWLVLPALLLVLPLAGTVQAKPRGKFEREHAKSAGVAKQALTALFEEAMEQEHLYQAALVARALVRFDPDNEKAREHLDDERKDGKWIVSTREIDHDDEDEEAAEAFEKRRLAKIAEVAEPLRLLLKHKKARKDGEARRHLIEDLVALQPEDADLVAAHRFTTRDGYWITTDIPRGDKIWQSWFPVRLAVLKKKFNFTPTKPLKQLRAIDIPWQMGLTMAYLQAWGTVSPYPLNFAGRRVIALRAVFRKAFDKQAELPGSLSFVVVEKREHYDKVVDAFELSAADKQRAKSVAVAKLTKRPLLLVLADSRDAAMAGMIRMAAHEMLERTFGVGKQSEWLHRGLGATLELVVTNTRMAQLATGAHEQGATDATKRLEAAMREKDASWPTLARELIAAGKLPPLASVVSKARGEIHGATMLTCYLAGVFIAVTFPDRTPKLLAALGKGALAKDAIPEILGLSIQALESRYMRYWKDNGGTAKFGERVQGPPPR